MSISRRKKKQEVVEEVQEEIVEVIETDEVVDNAQEFFENNKTLILGGIVALVLLVVAFLAYKYAYKMPREKEASEQIYLAEQQFAKDSFAVALENPQGTGFLDIIDSYGGTKAANLAKYYAGVSYLNLGRFDDAVDYLKDFSPAGEISPIMKHGVLGDAYSELDDLGAAKAEYKKAASSDNSFLTPYYLNKLGLLSIKEGDKDAAKEYFAKIKENYPKSNEAGQADYYSGL